MEQFKRTKTVVMSTVRAGGDRLSEIIIDPVMNPGLDEDLKDGWQIISAFPCVLVNAAAIVAVLGHP